jgi:hypothetical protein
MCLEVIVREILQHLGNSFRKNSDPKVHYYSEKRVFVIVIPGSYDCFIIFFSHHYSIMCPFLWQIFQCVISFPYLRNALSCLKFWFLSHRRMIDMVMLFRKTSTVYLMPRSRSINTLCGQNTELLNVNYVCSFRNHCA